MTKKDNLVDRFRDLVEKTPAEAGIAAIAACGGALVVVAIPMFLDWFCAPINEVFKICQ